MIAFLRCTFFVGKNYVSLRFQKTEEKINYV